ncbi:MAG: sigma-70 family RNA polymerase sigma factor, partial [Chitinophagales bacterium]|nr:sigma-70 family RNA polymerase sigma factor [Chitinophagales bacterium]
MGFRVLKKPTENDLVAALLRNEEAAYAYLYDHYSAMVYGIICQSLKSENQAEMVMQDVFVKIWKNINAFDPQKGKLATWIIQITRNAAIDFLRSKQYKVNTQNQNIDSFVSSDRVDSNLHTIAATTVTAQTNIDTIGIRDLLQALNEDQRKILDLMYFKGYTQAEVSESLGMPLGTVKTKT